METFEDIIREIRGNCNMYDGSYATGDGDALADRLDEAYKRDMQTMVDAGERDLETLSTEFATKKGMYLQALTKCDSEIARLKAALKPVQDAHIPDFSICDTCRDRSECEKNEDSETCEWYDIVEAVREAHKNLQRRC